MTYIGHANTVVSWEGDSDDTDDGSQVDQFESDEPGGYGSGTDEMGLRDTTTRPPPVIDLTQVENPTSTIDLTQETSVGRLSIPRPPYHLAHA